jgi:hypothetical protein
LTCLCLNLNPGDFGGSTPLYCSCGELRLLISWCVGDRHDMMGSDEDHGRNRRPGAEDWGWSSTGRVLGGWTVEMSGDTVCGLHRAEGYEEREFLDLASNQGRRFLPVSPQNRWLQVFWIGPQNWQLRFGDLTTKSSRLFLGLCLKIK